MYEINTEDAYDDFSNDKRNVWFFLVIIQNTVMIQTN